MYDRIFEIIFINRLNRAKICGLYANWTPKKGELINFMGESYEILEISYTIQDGTIPVIVLVEPFKKGSEVNV